MDLHNSTILEGCTPSFAAGTAATLLSTGEVPTSIYFADDTNLLMRREISTKLRGPVAKADAPNGYTQPRATMLLKIPRTLNNGAVSVDTLRIELATDVETSEADKNEMRDLAMQVLHNYDEFWNNQNSN